MYYPKKLDRKDFLSSVDISKKETLDLLDLAKKIKK